MHQTLLNDTGAAESKIVNVATLPLRSPFRYPGGKTWLIPLVRKWLSSMPKKPETFVEPFAGGGIISLTVAMEALAKQVVMSEIEPGVAAAWRVFLNGSSERFVQRILDFDISRKAVVEELSKPPETEIDLAFQTILKNRTHRGGIVAQGASLVRAGENGKGVASRWYPQTLAKRIKEIKRHSHRIRFEEEDAFETINEFLSEPSAVFFIDPPYTYGGKAAGKRLYTFSEVDHLALFDLLSKAKGRFLATYEDSPEVRRLAETYGFSCERVSMKNTHHAKMTELIVMNAS